MVFKGTLRTVKNVTNGYSGVEAKVRTVTSNDNVIPSGAQMQELAELSHRQYVSCLRGQTSCLHSNNSEYFVDMVTMLDKRLNDKGKYWRHVYKVRAPPLSTGFSEPDKYFQSLVVVEYLLHSGSPNVAQYFRDNVYLIKTLTEFQAIDDNGRDVGADVRVRARELSRLLADDKALAETRQRRKQMRDRMAGKRVSESNDETSEVPRRPQQPKKPSREEQDVQRALQLSERDEVERQRRLAEQSKEGLFDDPKPASRYVIHLFVPCRPT